MRLLVVEDDVITSHWLQLELKRHFPDSTIQLIRTEAEFRARFVEIASNPPDIVILDIVLRWAEPGQVIPPTICRADVNTDEYYEAGYRCQAMLAADERTKRVPVIFHSVLDRELEARLKEMPSNVQMISKLEVPFKTHRANTFLEHRCRHI